MGSQQKEGLGVVILTALVVGTMIGSGIFSIPQNMAEGAGAGAILIAWCITFFGMLTISRVFQNLATKRPDIRDSFYGYARHGFGDYVGLNAAWGHWLSVCIGNTGYLSLVFSALGSLPFLGFFGEGNTLYALIGQLSILVLFQWLIGRGIKSAAAMNVAITIAKIVPILFFILVILLSFQVKTLRIDFWGTPAMGNILSQVKTTMLYTVWVFIGIESANVYSSRARDMATVSRATIFGFLITFLLLVMVSVLSLGIVPQHELAQMKNPSMAGVIAHALGPWAAFVIYAGLIVSVLGALLAWIMIAAEILCLAARGKHNTAPSILSHENQHGTPIYAMRLGGCVVAVLLVLAFFSHSGYNALVQLATSMELVPYCLSALFAFKLSRGKEWTQGIPTQRHDRWLAGTAIAYGGWLLWAAGLRYLLLGTILYAPAIGFYLYSKHERGEICFERSRDKILAATISLLAIIALYLVATGELHL